MATRQELVTIIGEQYRSSAPATKRRILEEFVALTGYHRKHALRVLNVVPGDVATPRRGRTRLYDDAVQEALVLLWEASDRLCAKRLKVMIPVLIAAMARHGHLQLEARLRAQLLAVSPATIDRLLASMRVQAKGRSRRRTGASALVRRLVPIRTFNDWDDPAPGYCEVDLILHCGGRAVGSFVHTLVLTDLASGWTECMALPVREQQLVVEAIVRMREQLPVVLLGVDTDNDGVFINQCLISYCGAQGIEQTRSRPYRKNDQAWVEQKNRAVVRRLTGYGRLEGRAASQGLARLYHAARLFVNFFQPSMKLLSHTREGAKVTKRYDPPRTPCDRLLASARVPEAVKSRLRTTLATLDPIRILHDIRDAQAGLAALMQQPEIPLPAEGNHADVEQFLTTLATAWRSGEVRPTHGKKSTVPHTWRTREDPFGLVWPLLLSWLEAEPSTTARALFERLQAAAPQPFPVSQLRTLQRRVKAWRGDKVRTLLQTHHDTHGGGSASLTEKLAVAPRVVNV